MKMCRPKLSTVAVAIFLLGSAWGNLKEQNLWAAESPKAQIRTCLMQGVEKGFDLDETGAVAELTKAVELDKENPLGYALLGLRAQVIVDLLQPLQGQTAAGLAVGAVLIRGQPTPGVLTASLGLSDRLTAGGARLGDLP